MNTSLEQNPEGQIPQNTEFFEAEMFSEMQERAKKLESKQRGISVELFSKVFNKEGETVRGVFMGMRKLPNRGRTNLVDSVCWMGADGKLYYNQGKVLYDQFEKAGFQFGMDFEIRYDGPKPSDSRIKMYTVFLLKD